MKKEICIEEDKYGLDIDCKINYEVQGDLVIYSDISCFMNDKNINNLIDDLSLWDDICEKVTEGLGFKEYSY